ncbi:MAG: hypothetical protein ACRC7N_14335, partial [Clostridium sp.]
MHNINNKLKLSYSPMTIYEFENFKEDEDIRQYLNSTTIYVITKRKLPVMNLIEANPTGFTIEVFMEGFGETIKITMESKENVELLSGLSAFRIG